MCNLCIFVDVFDPNYLMLSNISIPYLHLPLSSSLSLSHPITLKCTRAFVHSPHLILIVLSHFHFVLVFLFRLFLLCFALLQEIISSKVHWICLTFVFYFRMKVNVTASNRQWLSWKKKCVFEWYAGVCHTNVNTNSMEMNAFVLNISENTCKRFNSKQDNVVCSMCTRYGAQTNRNKFEPRAICVRSFIHTYSSSMHTRHIPFQIFPFQFLWIRYNVYILFHSVM